MLFLASFSGLAEKRCFITIWFLTWLRYLCASYWNIVFHHIKLIVPNSETHCNTRETKRFSLLYSDSFIIRPQDNAVQDNNTVTDFYLSHSPSRYLSHLNNLFFSKIISTVTVWQIILTFKLYESKLENHPYSFTLKDFFWLKLSGYKSVIIIS